MIPHTMHWVWLGNGGIPEKDRVWMQSWLRHNGMPCFIWADHPETIEKMPGFEVRPVPPLVNQKWYDSIERWVTGRAAIASRSDIVRYEIIARHGGVYLDTDVECFKNIGPLLEGVNLFVSDEWGPRPGNFMFGAAPNHPAMWTVVRELGPHLNGITKKVNAVEACGPEYLGRQLRKHQDLVIFPHMLFNPLCAYDDPNQVEEWPAVSYGNHRYDGKWYDRTKRKPPAEFLKRGVA